LAMDASSAFSISVSCPKCGERLAVRAENRGRLGQCRGCGTVFRIGAEPGPVQGGDGRDPADLPTTREQKGSGARTQIGLVEKGQTSSAATGAAAIPPQPPKRTPPATTTFGCSLCQTRITAALGNVGKKVKCPDCGRVNVIPPPEPVEPPKTPAAMSGPQFDLWGVGEGPSAADLVARTQTLHPVVCELCQTLMYAIDEQVGKKLKCPDCGALTTAHRRVVEKPRGPVLVPDGQEYKLDEASAPLPRPAYKPVTLRDWREGEGDGAHSPTPSVQAKGRGETSSGSRVEEGEPREESRRAVTPRLGDGPRAIPSKMPRVPLVQGFWRMVFTSEVLVRWFGLSIALIGAGWFLSWIFSAMSAAVFLALPMYAIGCAFAGAWLVTAMPLCLEIVTESSEGSDRLHDPPNPISPEFGQALFVIIAAAVSMFPAWLTLKATGALPLAAQDAIFTGTFLLVFPVVLLSNLEQSSAFAVLSLRLVASLGRCAGPWLLLYILSGVLAAALYGTLEAIIRGPGWLIYGVPFAMVAAMLIYMRLIGRLAWWLAETMPAEEIEAPGG
jgi:DNA-directed RNA polymerase subunit M/transcription elongation factor TFIIS